MISEGDKLKPRCNLRIVNFVDHAKECWDKLPIVGGPPKETVSQPRSYSKGHHRHSISIDEDRVGGIKQGLIFTIYILVYCIMFRN